MNSKQQYQTKKYFHKVASDWLKQADIKKNLILNTINQRNLYVIDVLKKYKSRSILDVGCGTGDLSFDAAKYVNKSVGIDFASNMIKTANKKFKKKNLEFILGSIFENQINYKFDCISANGFIEYISLKQIREFFKISSSLLNKKGLLVFGTRNRLYNLFSLNKFTEKEKSSVTYNKFLEECISLNNLNLKSFVKLKKNKFDEARYKQPKVKIEVEKRHQFSPLQLIDVLNQCKFDVIDLFPVNYHPITPKNFAIDKPSKLYSNYIYKCNIKNKLPLIPFSSTFMVLAKKRR